MKAKCVKGGCGHEFENDNQGTFFDTIDEGEILFKIDIESCNVVGYVECPVCGSHCIEATK